MVSLFSSSQRRTRLGRPSQATGKRSIVLLGAALGWTLLALTGGCQMVLDPDRPQCKNDTDCVSFGASAGRCENDYCVAAMCATTTQCGADALCMMPEGECVATTKASCRQHEDCAKYESATYCGFGVCRHECKATSECRRISGSPTIECKAGRCVDEAWGCRDMRQEPEDASAVSGFMIRITGLQDNIRPTAPLTIRVCDHARYDEFCPRPVGGTKVDYNPDTMWATVTGIPVGARWRLVVEAPSTATLPASERLVPIDYYSQSPLQPGGMEIKSPLRMVPESIGAQQNVIDTVDGKTVASNPRLASILATIHDCTGSTAQGVQYDLDPRSVDTFDFYFKEGGLPDPKGYMTESSGRGTFVNLDKRDNYTVTATVNGLNVISKYTVWPLPGRLTQVDMYPGVFPEL